MSLGNNVRDEAKEGVSDRAETIRLSYEISILKDRTPTLLSEMGRPQVNALRVQRRVSDLATQPKDIWQIEQQITGKNAECVGVKTEHSSRPLMRRSRASMAAVGLVLGIASAGCAKRDATPATLNQQPASATPAATSAPTSAPAPGSGAAVPSLVSANATAAEYKKALLQLKGSIDYTNIDVRARQATIGTDPQAIARFVREEIRFESYDGALRGARGTLMARAGNSLDRSLLLAAMLRAAGNKVRFAEGTLSPSQAEQLVRSGFGSRPALLAANSPLMPVLQRAKEHFFYLGRILNDAHFTAPEDDAGAWDKAVSQAKRHFWAQLEAGGRWTDVDPSPGVPYGNSLVPATAQREEPDPALFHTIEIRVDIESIHEGKRETKTVLRHIMSTTDLAGLPVGMFNERRPDHATPILMVGDQLIRGESIKTTTTIGGAAGVSVPVVNPFDVVSDKGPDRISGEWLTVRVVSPSGTRQASYTIVDTEGPAARQAGAAPKEASPETITKVLDALDSFVGIGIATGQVPSDLLASLAADSGDPDSDTSPLHLLAMTAFTDHFARALLPPSLLKTPPLWYIDSPDVVIARTLPDSSTKSLAVSLDLTLKGYRSLRTPDDPLWRRAFFDHLAAGVIDQTLERWLLGARSARGSVGAMFEDAVKQQIGARTIVPPARASAGFLTPDGESRLSASLERGQIVILPSRIPEGWTSAAGWWSVDPATGWTEDTTEDGLHVQFVDRAALQRFVQRPGYRAFCAVGTSVAFVGGIVAVIPGGAHIGAAIGIIGGAVGTMCAIVNGVASGPPALPPGGAPPALPPSGPPPPALPPPPDPGGLPPDVFNSGGNPPPWDWWK